MYLRCYVNILQPFNFNISLIDVLNRFSSLISINVYTLLLAYLKDSNAAAHSVDNDIFYVVIDLSARSKSYIITFIS